jgi:hypothetical protein
MAEQGRRRRIRRDSNEWSSLLVEQGDSGLSQRAFCASKGVSLSSFCAAKRRLGMHLSPVARMDDFLEIPVRSMSAPGWEVELDLGDGVVLRLRHA